MYKMEKKYAAVKKKHKKYVMAPEKFGHKLRLNSSRPVLDM